MNVVIWLNFVMCQIERKYTFKKKQKHISFLRTEKEREKKNFRCIKLILLCFWLENSVWNSIKALKYSVSEIEILWNSIHLLAMTIWRVFSNISHKNSNGISTIIIVKMPLDLKNLEIIKSKHDWCNVTIFSDRKCYIKESKICFDTLSFSHLKKSNSFELKEKFYWLTDFLRILFHIQSIRFLFDHCKWLMSVFSKIYVHTA